MRQKKHRRIACLVIQAWMLVEPTVVPIDSNLQNRQPRTVGQQRQPQRKPPARFLPQIEANGERMRSIARAAIRGAGLKREPIARCRALANNENRILLRVGVVDAALAVYRIIDGAEFSRGFIENADLPERFGKPNCCQ